MRIGLDLTLLRPDRMTGVERYAKNLTLELLRSGSGFEWVLFFRFPPPDFLRGLPFEAHVAPVRNRLAVDQIWLPWAARRAKLDLLHAPAFPTPLLYSGKTVLTVHDAAMWRFPRHVSRGTRLYYRPIFPTAIRRARRVITVSDFSRRELETLLGLPPGKVVPILEGLDAGLRMDRPRAEAAEPFVLSVGTIEPRKNLSTLIEAMGLLPERHRRVPLILVGRRGWQDPARLPAGPVEWLGHVEDSRLRELYRSATVFAIPSLYEGFGLPLLEALAAGAPCLSSSAGSLPEVGGDACLYADPAKPAEWAEKLTQLLDQAKLREELSGRALAQSRKFDWTSTARQTLEVYRQAL